MSTNDNAFQLNSRISHHPEVFIKVGIAIKIIRQSEVSVAFRYSQYPVK